MATAAALKRRSIFERIEDLLAEPSCSSAATVAPQAAVHRTTAHDHCERCETCGKEYKTASALKMHQRTHAPPCVCHKCGKAFSRPWLLKGHLRTHTGERPYACAECGRRFSDRSNLRAHEHTHKTERRHRCGRCMQTFARSHVLLKHEESCGGASCAEDPPCERDD